MTFLYNKNVNVQNNSVVVTTANPFPVTAVGDGLQVDGISPDAFGRTRVSELFTLGDYKHIYAIDPNFLNSTGNGGTVTYQTNKASANLAVTSTASSYAVHQTKSYHHYQPGKSQMIFSSVCFGFPQQNVTKRTGYFDDRDGIYFEQVGSNTADGTNQNNGTQTLNFVIRTYTSGSVDESTINTTVNGQAYTYKRRIPQSEWNVDKCDGTGISGFKIDMSKTQLIYIDFQWLGVGRARVGFVHDGKVIIAHEYYNSNVLSEPYMANPNLPVRCEIRSTGTTTGGSMLQICAHVGSEGGYAENGIDYAIIQEKRTVGTTLFPVLAIRLKSSFGGYPNRISVRMNSLSLSVETNTIIYEIVKIPNATTYLSNNTTSLTWTSAATNSGVEYCINADAYTDGEVLYSGFVPAGSSQNSLSPVSSSSLTGAKKNVIVQNFDSTDSEVYVIACRTLTTSGNPSASVAAAVQWREIY